MKITGTIHNYQMDVLISDLNLIQDLLKSCTLNRNKTLDDLRIDHLLEIISDKMETYDSNNILPYHITDIDEYDDEYYDDYDPIQDTCFKLWVFFYSIIPRPRFYSDKNEVERLSNFILYINSSADLGNAFKNFKKDVYKYTFHREDEKLRDAIPPEYEVIEKIYTKWREFEDSDKYGYQIPDLIKGCADEILETYKEVKEKGYVTVY